MPPGWSLCNNNTESHCCVAVPINFLTSTLIRIKYRLVKQVDLERLYPYGWKSSTHVKSKYHITRIISPIVHLRDFVLLPYTTFLPKFPLQTSFQPAYEMVVRRKFVSDCGISQSTKPLLPQYAVSNIKL